MVQIAEQLAAPKTLEATLTYFVDTETMPVTVVGAPGGKGSPIFGIRVAKNKLVVRFAHACDSTNDSSQLLACRAIND